MCKTRLARKLIRSSRKLAQRDGFPLMLQRKQGLLHEIRTTKFLGTVYILKEVLPELSKLSKTFQYSKTNISTVQSSVDYRIDRLKKIREMTPLKNV